MSNGKYSKPFDFLCNRFSVQRFILHSFFSISPKHAKMKYRGSEIDKTSIMCLYYLENLKSKNLILILFKLTFCILILLMIFFLLKFANSWQMVYKVQTL